MKSDQLKTQRIVLEFIENGFQCKLPCEEWLEIKYKTKKEANGNSIYYIKFFFINRQR